MPDAKHDILIRVLADLDQLKGQLGQLEAVSKASAEKTARTFDTISVAAGKAVVAYEAVKRTIDIVNRAMAPSLSVDQAKHEVRTLINVTDAEFARISSRIDAISLQVPQTAAQLWRGYYEVLSSSRQLSEDPLNAIEMLDTTARAAVGGLTETATSVKITTDIIAAYNLEAGQAGHVSDLLFKSVADGKTRFDELAQHLGPLLPIANSLGISLEELMGAVTALTLQGFRTPIAVTGLASFLRSMATVSKEGQERAKALGITWDTTVVKSKGLVGAMQILRDAVGTDAEAMKDLVNDTEGWQAALALTGQGFNTLRGEVAAMSDVAGASKGAFDEMSQSGQSAATILASTASTIWRSWSDEALPALQGLKAFVVNDLPAIKTGISVTVEAVAGLAVIMTLANAEAAYLKVAAALRTLATAASGAGLAASAANPWLLALGLAATATIALDINGKIGAVSSSADQQAESFNRAKDAADGYGGALNRTARQLAGLGQDAFAFGDPSKVKESAEAANTFADAMDRARTFSVANVSPIYATISALNAASRAAKAAGDPIKDKAKRDAEAKAEADRWNALSQLLMDIDSRRAAKQLAHREKYWADRAEIDKRALDKSIDAQAAIIDAQIEADQRRVEASARVKAELVLNTATSLSDALAGIWSGQADGYKQMLRALLMAALDALHAKMAIVKAWAAAESIFNFLSIPGNLAKLATTEALFAAARGVVMRFETGGPGDFGGFQGLITQPTMFRQVGRVAKIVGEREAEFVAPQKQFREWANEQLAPLLRGGGGGLSDADRSLLVEIRDALNPTRFGHAAGKSIGRELRYANPRGIGG